MDSPDVGVRTQEAQVGEKLSPEEIRNVFRELIGPIREKTNGWETTKSVKDDGTTTETRRTPVTYDKGDIRNLQQHETSVSIDTNPNGEDLAFSIIIDERSSIRGGVQIRTQFVVFAGKSDSTSPLDKDSPWVSYDELGFYKDKGFQSGLQLDNTPRAVDAGKAIIARLPQTVGAK